MSSNTRQVIYLLETGEVLCFGYCDWASGSFFDDTIHGIVHNDTYPIPPCDEPPPLYWDAGNEEFTDTAP